MPNRPKSEKPIAILIFLCLAFFMKRRKRKRANSPTIAASERAGMDAAWRVQEALRDWTGKIENKASFALALESAAIAGTVALSGNGRIFSEVHGAANGFLTAGRSLLAVAIIFAAAVIMPPIHHGDTRKTHKENYFWFGHLRHWSEPSELAERWRNGDILPVIARQVIVSSKITWRKHRFLQFSLIIATLAIGSLAISSLL